MQGFVKYPPKGLTSQEAENNELLVSELELSKEMGLDSPLDGLWIGLKVKKFRETQDPLVGIEVVMLCHEAGVYPPGRVMEWLADSFSTWHKNNGQLPLERLMGLKASGKTGNSMKEGIQEQLKENLMRELWQLKDMFGITNAQASAMIADRLEDGSWNNTGMQLRTYNETTLKKMYENEYAKLYREDAKEREKHGIQWSKEDKREALSHYPLHAYEHLDKMKDYL